MTPSPRPKDEATRRRLARQRQRDTSPELAVRRALTRLGKRYRIAPGSLPGSPDLANRTAGWAIFVHGCYWHHHPGCRRATLPKNNRAWWQSKFEANRERDERKTTDLHALGLRVLVVWECETKNEDALFSRLESWL